MTAADHARAVQLFQVAAQYSVDLGARPNAAADRFLEAVSALGAEDRTVWEEVIAHVEGLERDSYHPMMVAAEALAVCLLGSDAYAPVVRDWARRDHPSARTAAVAAYSKVSDVDVGAVDFTVLAQLVARLDAEPSDDDEVTRMYLSRLACKLRATDAGARLIGDMATRGAPLRIAAVHAISTDLSTEPPERHLDALRRLKAQRPSSEEPPRRLFWLLLALLHDPDPAVKHHGEWALELVRGSWPALWNRLVDFRLSPSELPSLSLPRTGTAEFPGDAETAVAAALTDLRTRTGGQWLPDELHHLRPRDLDRSRSHLDNPPGVDFALGVPQRVNKRAGVRTWDPEMLEQDRRAEATGDEDLPVVGTPRLFLSYRWSQDAGMNGAADAFAGSLFNGGYDIVFDRDPRHIDKHLSAGDVLLLLYSCTHFVLLETEELADFLAEADRTRKSPIGLELQLARALADEGELQWLPVRLQEEGPFAPDERFPERRFRVVATFADGHSERSQPVERRHVRKLGARARAVEDVVHVVVHDIARAPH